MNFLFHFFKNWQIVEIFDSCHQVNIRYSYHVQKLKTQVYSQNEKVIH